MGLKPFSIGIDLGMANTCTAVFRNDRAEIITHEGELLMPSYVAFNENGRLIGLAAKNQAGVNPENTIFGALRFIGMKLHDPELQKALTMLPFRVVEKNDGVAFVVRHRGIELIITPVEIIAMTLARARRDAQYYLGQSSPTTNAVITVPARFSMGQRQAIWDAALIANVNPLRIISAPVCACIDFAVVHPPVKTKHNVLVVDFGAGSLDISLMTQEEYVINIRAVASDLGLGGDDIDTALMTYMTVHFMLKTKLNLLGDPRALRRLRTACEKAKEELSFQQKTVIEIDELFKEQNFVWPVNRNDLEECCRHLINSTFLVIDRVLGDSGMDKNSIQTLLLTGGSSRMPIMQTCITEYFGARLVPRIFNPDETAARGAATYAAVLYRDGSSKLLDNIALFDVAPLTIGIETTGGAMTKIIERNTSIPARKSEVFSTFQDNQTGFSVAIYEGEGAQVKNNNFLGQLGLSLPPAPRGVPQIELTMHYRHNGEIEVHAEHRSPGGDKSRMLLAHPGRLSQYEFAIMKRQAEALDDSDAIEEERIKARTAAEAYVFTLKEFLASQYPNPDNVVKIRIRRAELLLKWLDANPQASTEEYTSRVKRLKHEDTETPNGSDSGKSLYLLPPQTAPSEWGFISNEAREKKGSMRNDGAVASLNGEKRTISFHGAHTPH
jgi:heat shock protein 1/8